MPPLPNPLGICLLRADCLVTCRRFIDTFSRPDTLPHTHPLTHPASRPNAPHSSRLGAAFPPHPRSTGPSKFRTWWCGIQHSLFPERPSVVLPTCHGEGTRQCYFLQSHFHWPEFVLHSGTRSVQPNGTIGFIGTMPHCMGCVLGTQDHPHCFVVVLQTGVRSLH